MSWGEGEGRMTNLVCSPLTFVYFRGPPLHFTERRHDNVHVWALSPKDWDIFFCLVKKCKTKKKQIFRIVHFWFCIYNKKNHIFIKSIFFSSASFFFDVLCHLRIFLQITELLDDERCEAECEELPQDGEEVPTSPDSPQHTETDDSPATG